MKRFLEHIIYSNLVISLGSGFLTWGVAHVYGIQDAYEYGLLLFALTHFIYNFQRLAKDSLLGHSSPQIYWLRNHLLPVRTVTVVSLLCATVLFFYLFQWRLSLLLIGLFFVLISLLYVLPIKGKNLRDWPYLKIHLIALVWVFACTLFPILNEGLQTNTYWWFGINHYWYILAITIPFDIRDMHVDDSRQRTIPQMVGSPVARILAIASLLTFGIVNMVLFPGLMVNPFFYLALVFQGVLILGATERKPFWYFGGLLDGGIVLLGVSYLFIR